MTSVYTSETIRQARAMKETIDREYWRAIKFNDREKRAEIEQLYKEMGEKPDLDKFKQ